MSLVSVSPEEITFPNVVNQEAVFMLKVKNNSSSAVAFKVKTTAPKNYLVKPSSGAIPGNGVADIKITLNKQVIDPSMNADRFLVQAVKSEEGKELTKEEWAAIDKTAIQEIRMHVVFTGSSASGGSKVLSSRPDSPVTPVTGGAASGAVAPLDADASLEKVRSKYDELYALSLQLEKDKKKLESDLDACRLQVRKSKAISSSPNGFSTLQLIIAMILAVILARVATIMGY